MSDREGAPVGGGLVPMALVAACALAVGLGGCDGGGHPVDGGPDADSSVDGGADADSDAETEQHCWSCHGSEGDPSPPPALSGSTDRADPGVGAHRAHMAGSALRSEVRCTNCHVVPASVGDEGHIDDERPADVRFSGLASFLGRAEMRDGRCAVYCHGSFLRISPDPSPAWTSGASLGCTGCHGSPPGAPHPAAADCGRCHIDVATPGGAIVRPWLHIDGINQAPKGAHLVHLGGAGGPAYACSDCHQGTNVHGPLRDGAFLEETTICADCHETGTVDPEAWRGYSWP